MHWIAQSTLEAILHGIENPTVVELGAHTGMDTVWVHGACRGKVKYLAVEPDYRHWDSLRSVCDPRGIPIFAGAVGAVNALKRLKLSVNDLGKVPASSSLRKPKLHLQLYPWCRFEETYLVPVLCLDWLMHIRKLQPDFLWVDIQGGEGDMLAGGRYTLSKTKWLYSESYETEMYEGQMLRPEYLRVLGELGFELVEQDQENVLLRNIRL